ncbi:MAG: calcium/proton exchanger [Gemmatimonadota bacterium]
MVWWRLARENALLLLLVFVPVALLLEYAFHANPVWIFVTASLAIIPLAALMGRATERLAERVGEGVGGLLNATFGNAAELIIAIIALNAGLIDLVKASITGSIIGNVLLVFGLSALVGGVRFRTQRFNRTAASLGTTLLVLSAIGLVVPAIFHRVALAERPADAVALLERELSLEIAIVLMVTYVLSLFFTLRTHSHLYAGSSHGAEDADGGEEEWVSTGAAVLLLVAATTGIAFMAELLIGAVEPTAAAFGMNEVFVGVILVAVIGNAAEHSTAILMAAKNKMDAAVSIAVGSSIQIALFVAPLLLFLSYFIAPQPMDLLFTSFEVVAVGLSVGIIAFVAHDGETHWMEGVQLLAVYVILAIAFFFLPVSASP